MSSGVMDHSWPCSYAENNVLLIIFSPRNHSADVDVRLTMFYASEKLECSTAITSI